MSQIPWVNASVKTVEEARDAFALIAEQGIPLGPGLLFDPVHRWTYADLTGIGGTIVTTTNFNSVLVNSAAFISLSNSAGQTALAMFTSATSGALPAAASGSVLYLVQHILNTANQDGVTYADNFSAWLTAQVLGITGLPGGTFTFFFPDRSLDVFPGVTISGNAGVWYITNGIFSNALTTAAAWNVREAWATSLAGQVLELSLNLATLIHDLKRKGVLQ